MKYYTFEIVIRKEPEDPGFYATCPALPGCFSNGLTLEDTKRNMQEAIALHLEGLREDGEDVPGDEDPIILEKLLVGVPD